MPASRPQKITLAEMRDMGVRLGNSNEEATD
jgi:hypothetical protein